MFFFFTIPPSLFHNLAAKPRVNVNVQNIDQQIDHADHSSDEKDPDHNDGHIILENSLQQIGADAGEREDGLRDDRTAEVCPRMMPTTVTIGKSALRSS